MNNESKIKEIIKSQFDFLCTDLGATIVNEKINSYGIYITYKNEKAGLRVSFEPREGGIFVMIFPLLEGEIPAYQYWHDVFDLFQAKNVTFKGIILKDNYNPELTNFRQALKKFADYVQIYASDFLKGDFEIIPDLKLIVKKRADEMS